MNLGLVLLLIITQETKEIVPTDFLNKKMKSNLAIIILNLMTVHSLH